MLLTWHYRAVMGVRVHHACLKLGEFKAANLNGHGYLRVVILAIRRTMQRCHVTQSHGHDIKSVEVDI